MKFRLCALLATFALTTYGTAIAAPVVYTGFTQNPTCPDNDATATSCATKFAPTGAAKAAHDAFFGSLTSSVATNDFESIANGTTPPLTLNFGFAGNATLAGSSGSVEAEPVFIAFGRFATSGSQYFQTSVSGNDAFELQFSQLVAGFGLYGMDWGDIGGSVGVTLLNGATEVASYVVQPSLGIGFFSQLNGGMRFFGVLDTANSFDRVRFVLTGNPEDADVFGFDDLTVADASQVVPPSVPEPATLALLGVALGGLALSRRRNLH